LSPPRAGLECAAGRPNHASQRHVENPTPQERVTTIYAATMLLPPFDAAPLSSARSLWSMLVCADIERAGSGARVPVEVEHDPFVGEVDAGIDERRSGGRY
jgi:hypothetical protein